MNVLFKILLIILSITLTQATFATCLNPNPAIIFQIDHVQMIFDQSTIDSATIATPKKPTDTYGVQLKLKETAADDFAAITQHNIGKVATVTMNGKIVSSSTIQTELGAEFFISGLTKEQADEFIRGLELTK